MAASGPEAAHVAWKERIVKRRTPWAVYLWPGLAQIWHGGGWLGLAAAIGAAVALNAALLGSFGWSELIAAGGRKVLWVVVGSVWSASAVFSATWSRRRELSGRHDTAEDAFCEALDYYLVGNYFQAERLLAELLGRNPRDLDARLMLATLLRRTRRFDEAAGHLSQLTKFEGVEKWDLEIQRERELLAQARTKRSDPVEENAPPNPIGSSAQRKHAA